MIAVGVSSEISSQARLSAKSAIQKQNSFKPYVASSEATLATIKVRMSINGLNILWSDTVTSAFAYAGPLSS